MLLDEQPSLAQLAGVALVVGGIAIATVPVGRLQDRRSAGPVAGDRAGP